VSEAEQPDPKIIYVVYLPYLPLVAHMAVGDWELIPRSSLGQDDSLDARTAQLAEGLADVYLLPNDARSPAGAFARPHRGRIGDDPTEVDQLRDLQRALTVMVLEVIKSPLLPDDDRDMNAGHYALTSDNARVVAHGIDWEHGFTGAETGSRVRHRSLGMSVLENPLNPDLPRSKIPPPADLRIPAFRTPALDGEYADATWESMRGGNDAARRLGRAIDWLGLAWLNTTGLTDDLRVPALRAGFEVLLGSDDSDELADRLSRLLSDGSAAVERTWLTRAGNPASAMLSDVAWWFKRFSFLRNDLMHGRSPDREAWWHDGSSHTDLGEWYLRQAIKHAVANDGHGDILDELVWRDALRATREWQRAQRTQDLGAG
jgi:hypothetical protein